MTRITALVLTEHKIIYPTHTLASSPSSLTQISRHTVKFFTIRSQKERRALQRRTGHAKFRYLWDVRWHRCRVLVCMDRQRTGL